MLTGSMLVKLTRNGLVRLVLDNNTPQIERLDKKPIEGTPDLVYSEIEEVLAAKKASPSPIEPEIEWLTEYLQAVDKELTLQKQVQQEVQKQQEVQQEKQQEEK